MAVYNYKRYKISLRSDSKKIQGLQTGDIVRRQYYDGEQLIYTLMCVLEYGADEIVNESNNTKSYTPYFIGALLEGQAPSSNELLDFVRVTNLFNLNRSGALYLTASDSQSPYLDVIDGIAKNKSLCWPTNIAVGDYQDSQSQYVVTPDTFATEYIKSQDDISRICHLTYENAHPGFKGIKQDFYEYVSNPERILISFRAKASRVSDIKVTLGYSDESREDGCVTGRIGTEWGYYLYAITVDWSGRHLRSASVDFTRMTVGSEVWIGDFNVIRLSSITQFGDASHVRIGKLDGVVDPVFGKLDGYGGYLQKLYASNSTHISGTLTAGDEKGFGATFYAGRIHRNAFVNSLEPTSNGEAVFDQGNPTGIGKVYALWGTTHFYAIQSKDWYRAHIGNIYCFSFWAKFKYHGNIAVRQNGHTVGVIYIDPDDTHEWKRWHISFELLKDESSNDAYPSIDIAPIFELPEGVDDIEAIYYWSAPQLEEGKIATQYQPTDSILNYTDEYGAWFSRGGIGGTIQNPLLQLNYDGEGSIGTRTKSFQLRQDGSGYLANENISWDSQGRVEFGHDVTLNWYNIGDDARTELQGASIKILGPDTFIVAGNELSATPIEFTPNYIDLAVEEQNILTQVKNRKWVYDSGSSWVVLSEGLSKTCRILPNADYWRGLATLHVRCIVTTEYGEYSDSMTLRKHMASRYEVRVTSESGETFKNGACSTTLTAKVYYQGLQLPDSYVNEHFTFNWVKYELPDTEHPVDGWWLEKRDSDGVLIHPAIDKTQPSIVLNYSIDNQDLYVCELQGATGFPYVFPFILS